MTLNKKLDVLALLVLLELGLLGSLAQPLPVIGVYASQSLTSNESRVLSLVNGSRIYESALELENIALSRLAFRSGGSPGANATALWVAEKFTSLGLETYNESFQFTNWDLLAQPALTIDQDGNPDTTGDQISMMSFGSDHLSWPAPSGGVFADLVVLPLPVANNRGEIGLRPIDQTLWNSINTAGKIVLTGKEVTWDNVWRQTFLNKISSQVPQAIVFTWWYNWMSFTPPMISSGGGRPLGGAYYWGLHIPVGWVNYQEGLSVRNLESSLNVSAKLVLDSQIGQGTHNNVIGKITGIIEPSKYVIVSAHMDSVMTAGLLDNGGGTAAVVEVARVFSEAIRQGWYEPRYTILFVAFTDEEFGLVGSINYIIRHKTDMPNIVAVVNLDCIGSDNFEVSMTVPDPATGLDLDQVVLKAAQDLAIPATVVTGASDHETFRDPTWADGYYNYVWGLNAGISGVPAVESSVILASAPLLYSDLWNMGQAGWIHTSYDNSTSTATLSWVEPIDLENHVEIGALTLMRISGVPDVAVINVAISKTVAGQGCIAPVNVTVENQGSLAATVSVTLYANSSLIETKTLALDVGAESTLTFKWNTSIFVKANYQISAYVTSILGETDTSDNTLVDGWIRVALTGDISGLVAGVPDGKVDIRDLATMAKAYGSYPGHTSWNANADITGPTIGLPDNKVDIRDLALAAKNYGRIDP